VGVHRILILAGFVELVALGVLGWQPGRPEPFPGLFFFFIAFVAYAWAARSVASPGAGAAAGSMADSVRRIDLRLVWSVAIALRLILIPLSPELSDDVYRYLWDGHVQLSGVNPYVYAPADPALTDIRTPWHGLINHPGISTIYPPAAQLAFVLVAAAGSSILAAKLLWLILDLATAIVLLRVAERTGRNVVVVGVLYLWSPLLVVETAWSAHLEVLGLFWMVTLLLASLGAGGRVRATPRATAAGALIALAALTKFAPAAALPPLVRRHGWKLAAAAGGVGLLFYLPYLDAGPALWRGLATYARDWRANEGAFLLLEAISGTGGRRPRVLAGLLVLGVIAFATARRFNAERTLFWILGAGVALSPTVHPWYVLWVLPFAALRSNRAWILLTGLIFLGYWGLSAYHETGDWHEPTWARAVIWLPFWGMLLLDAVRGGPGGEQAAEAKADVAGGE
jgi:hypothetical protein